MARYLSQKLATVVLRTFQVLAYAEGALLPSILIVAIYHWVTGKADVQVAIVGARLLLHSQSRSFPLQRGLSSDESTRTS